MDDAIKQKLALRKQKVDQRNQIQREIQALSEDIDKAVLLHIMTHMGMIASTWKYVYNQNNFCSFPDELYLTDHALGQAVNKYVSECYGEDFLRSFFLFAVGILVVNSGVPHIKFDRKDSTCIRSFMQCYKLKIDFSSLDQEITEKQARKEKFLV